MSTFREGLDYGGGGPVKLTVANSPLVGDFYAIEADGTGPLVISSLVGLDDAATWNGTTLASGQTLLAGRKGFTSISISSGSGWVYTCG